MADNVYYIWGEEEYLIDEEIRSIIQQFNNGEAERVPVDADELDAAGLARALEYSPLFALNRVVIIKRPGFLEKSNRKTKKNDEIRQVLADALSQGEGQIIIITALEHNASNPVVKWLEKTAKVINCQHPEQKQLAKWVSDQFEQRRRKINPAALALLTKSGLDMYYLQNLIDKLCLLSDHDITEKEVQEQFSVKQDINVFKLIDTLMNRDIKAAMRAYNQLLVQGEHQIYLLYMVVRQFALLAQVKCYTEKGFTAGQIASRTAQKDFTVRRMMDKCSKFTHEEMQRLFTLLMEADINFKTTGKKPDTVMELLLTEICLNKK
jgi:DNA polymerase-3 subunit delta